MIRPRFLIRPTNAVGGALDSATMSSPVVPAQLGHYRLAPMSRSLAIMTVVLWGIPLVFAVIAVTTDFLPAMIFMIAMTVFIAGIYCWTWIRFRPSEFVLGDGAMEVIWPAKRRQVPYVGMHSAKIITRRELKDLVGFGMRVGAGGLWGAFGWLWTTKRDRPDVHLTPRSLHLDRAR